MGELEDDFDERWRRGEIDYEVWEGWKEEKMIDIGEFLLKWWRRMIGGIS